MKVEIKLTTPDKFHKTLHEKLPSRIEGNQLILDEAFGVGGMKFLQLQEGLYINQIDLKIKEPLELHRIAKKENDYFILNFHLSKSEIVQKSENKTYNLGFENINILLSSACAEAKMFIPPNVPIKIFNIGFTMDWLEENILSSKEANNLSIFRSNNPIYLFETINYLYKKKLKLVDLDKQGKLSIYSGTFQLLDYFFEMISKRTDLENEFQNVNLKEFGIMLKIRENIDNSIDSTLSVENLAKIAGMSLSKFKQLFKQIFGTTPYKYYLANRMERSMELLESKKYSVSEVGYLVGYANPSQFSKSFQKHFGILPSKVK